MPASRVLKKPGGATKDRSGRTQCQAEKTGIVEQVTRWQDSKTGLKEDHPYLDEDHSAYMNNVKAATTIAWQMSPTLPTANAGATRTRWLRQHAIDVATQKVHPGWKNGKGRDRVAEQLGKTWRQWCHTST